jgi:Flp pilus assembly protein TadB
MIRDAELKLKKKTGKAQQKLMQQLPRVLDESNLSIKAGSHIIACHPHCRQRRLRSDA